MILKTFSAFYYGYRVTQDNAVMPINEGFGEIAVTLPTGSYTLTDFVNVLASTLNESGSLTYQASVNRLTRRITISASANFSILWASSLNSDISIREIAGFNLLDLTGQSGYEGQMPSGKAYFPQFKLQDFIDFNMQKRSNSPTVRTSASGAVEVVKYANNFFMNCTITLITNITGQGAIKNNPNGVQDALDFMNFATDKNALEFIYDENNPSEFVACILESTSESRDGVDFTLQPLYSRGLTGYYELKGLQFRRLE